MHMQYITCRCSSTANSVGDDASMHRTWRILWRIDWSFGCSSVPRLAMSVPGLFQQAHLEEREVAQSCLAKCSCKCQMPMSQWQSKYLNGFEDMKRKRRAVVPRPMSPNWPIGGVSRYLGT